MPQPHLTFYCELDPAPLRALFEDPAVVTNLKLLGAAVSMGLRDLSDERAEVVRHLNAAGIPLVAWLLLPEEDGYWFNAGNAPQAAARYDEFRAWSERHGLRWERVGLDVEPDINEMEDLYNRPWRLLLHFLRRLLDRRGFERVRKRYAALVEHIRAGGYPVDAYQLPVLVDERRAGTTLVQRALRLIDLPVDREVLMLYSSFMRPHGHAVLWSYAPDARSVGVGSTGGGVTVNDVDQIPPLTWEEFSRDLRLAGVWSDDLHVFSLEGAVRLGYLERLRHFDWELPPEIPWMRYRRVRRARRWGRRGLWLAAHPLVLAAGAALLLFVLRSLLNTSNSHYSGQRTD